MAVNGPLAYDGQSYQMQCALTVSLTHGLPAVLAWIRIWAGIGAILKHTFLLDINTHTTSLRSRNFLTACAIQVCLL